MTQPSSRPPFPPQVPPGPVPPRRAAAGGLARVLAGVAALAAAGLAIGGSFAAIHSVTSTFGDDGAREVYDVNWWTIELVAGDTTDNRNSLIGVALAVAAAALLVGAVLAFVARSGRGGVVTASRSVLSSGAGLLAGAVLLQLMSTLDTMSLVNDEELDPGESIQFSAELGLWLPLGGVVLAGLAVGLAHAGRAVRQEPSTPRMGFPMPYGPVPTGQHRPVGAPAPVAGMPAAPAGAATPAGTATPPVPAGTNGTPAGAAVAASSLASQQDAEPEHDPDSDITQRTTVPGAVPPSTADTPEDASTPAGPVSSIPPAMAQQPAQQPAEAQPPAADNGASPAASADPAKPTEPAELTDLPAAPPAPELVDDKETDKEQK
ncbi:MAG TPA: hypothetical protein VNP92_13485 [Actinophytocola sp.]|nr:hypothetical protein [Actinophytocola sp.]